MRIKDLVSETGVLAGFRRDFQQGFDRVDRVLNPKRWGEEDQPVNTEKPINKLDLRDAVNSAISGSRFYLRDQQVIKQAYAQIKSGQLKTAQDSTVLLSALKAAGDQQKLSPQQEQILSTFINNL